jgi:rhamnose utilization protein RhaD (predicted bifunctional aldolase and dehydrogenase)
VEITELREISSFIGSQKNLVQGPGGNTSYKTQDRLFVKASGTRLDEALIRNIFAEIDLQTGENHTPSLRPSIELGLHSELPFKVVIHVHSVGSLAWGLRKRNKVEDASLSELGLLLAPYLRPGDEITSYLRSIDANQFNGILLQNHGLITWGNDCQSALNLLMTLESNLVSLAQNIVVDCTSVHSIKSIPNGMKLTPDHAVFSKVETEDPVEMEILKALDEALNLIPGNSAITAIDSEESSILQNWEAEIYRRGLN